MSSDSNQTTGSKEVTTLAGGCFWCLEAVFNNLTGVDQVVSGYTGGQLPDPSYEQVCTGRTGHAEAVQITFDPKLITYQDILGIFFSTHDPTTLNRQGADVGTQYRSAIYYHTPEQKATAEAIIADLTAEKIWKNRIVTELSPLGEFYTAEEYHQNYYARNPWQGYCMAVIAPKVAKMRKKYMDRLKV